MRENKQEYPCLIVDISAGGIAVQASDIVEIGEKIIIYSVNMGRVEGSVVRISADGFAMALSTSAYKREKIVNQLTWLVNKDKLSSLDDRQHNRFIPGKLTAKLTIADGSSHDCRIIDMSLGGAAILIEPLPGVGEKVILGLIPGRVVRHSDLITSIKFNEIQDPATLERQFN